MLALGMALIQRPELLLTDELSLGLSPSPVKQGFEMIKDMNKDYGMSILIVEQKVKEVLKLADKAYVLHLGSIALEDTSQDMLKTEAYKKIFLS